MRKTLPLLTLGFLLSCSDNQEASPPPEKPLNYNMTLDAKPISKTAVRFIVNTNLPLPVEVMADLNLAGQKDDDVWVGYQEKVFLTKPTTEFVLDTAKSDKPLPSAKYEAGVSFYPRWGAERNPDAKNAPNLSAADLVSLAPTELSAKEVTQKLERQRWVMGNTHMNMPWDEQSFVEKLGPYEKSRATLSHLHDAYYFPEADMTLIVNRLKGEMTIWRMGRATR